MNNEIVVFDEVMGRLAEFKAQNKNIVYDCRDPKGNKDCRSHIASLRKFKTHISDIHKEAKAGALAYGRRLDELKNKYTGEVVEMIDVQKAPLDEIEAEIQARIDEDVRIHAEAEAAKQADIEAKAKAYEKMLAKEATETAEAERIVREKIIAKEAAAKATAEAEAKAKLEAAAKEQTRIRAETEAKNEAAILEAKELARAADEEHQEEIQGDIEKYLVNTGMGMENAIDLLSALIEDKVPHVMIVY